MADRSLPEDMHMEPLAGRRAVPSSSNLSLIDEHSANGQVRALFAQYRERFTRGDVPGIVLCFATNPALLNGMLEIAANFLFCETLLSRRHKEMIATYVSQLNTCPYCTDSHAAFLGMQGGSSEIICALQDGNLKAQLFTHAELTLLKFAGRVSVHSSAVIRTDVEAVIHAGWTEEQVAEAVHVVALFAAFNRVANGFGLPTPYPDGL